MSFRSVQLRSPIPLQQQAIFDFLLEANRFTNANAVLRVAGGWVRDMVRGQPAKDIDIAVGSELSFECPGKEKEKFVPISGVDFAQKIVEYQKQLDLTPEGQKKLHASLSPWQDGDADPAATPPTKSSSSVSVVKTNPDKSKHLETAMLKLFGMELEFSNLRHDDYSQSPTNRTPLIRRGTPKEDAQRRDFRCNALFYNLHTRLVEDYVGGLEDIERRWLQCPLHPFTTFLDDPLRMLRGCRFAGTLAFHLSPDVVAATHTANLPTHESDEDAPKEEDSPTSKPLEYLGRPPALPQLSYPFFYNLPGPTPSMHPLTIALIHKVARERCATEFTKMFSGNCPARCLRALWRMRLLYDTVLVEAHAPAAPVGQPKKPKFSPALEPQQTESNGRQESPPPSSPGLSGIVGDFVVPIAASLPGNHTKGDIDAYHVSALWLRTILGGIALSDVPIENTQSDFEHIPLSYLAEWPAVADFPKGSETRMIAATFAIVAPLLLVQPRTVTAKRSHLSVASIPPEQTLSGKPTNPVVRVDAFACRWLKLPSRVGQCLGRMLASALRFRDIRGELLRQLTTGAPSQLTNPLRLQVFRALRPLEKDPDALVAAVVATTALPDCDCTDTHLTVQDTAAAQIAEQGRQLWQMIQLDGSGSLLASRVGQVKLTGNVLAQQLNITPGPGMAQLLEAQREFLCLNPAADDNAVIAHCQQVLQSMPSFSPAKPAASGKK